MAEIKKILCIGDIILDTYSQGLVERISPEAPIPVLRLTESDKEVLGGSGNVARNVTAAGDRCHLISVIGNDNDGKILMQLCKKTQNLTFDLVIDKERCTTMKRRFVSGNQQVLRVDRESRKNISKKTEEKILVKFNSQLKEASVVIISDYNKGVLNKNLLEKIIKTSKLKKKIVIVDPKNKDFSIYKSANIITPNLKELLNATNSSSLPVDDKLVERLSKKLIKSFKFQSIVTTKSSKGISLVNSNSKSVHLPSKAKEVFDVSGAGDTVVSYIASGILREFDLENSVKMANEAAGIAVSKFGTATVTRDEVTRKLKTKVSSLNNIIKEINDNNYRNVGFTNGCFDLLHKGHIDYLKKSREKCGFLIVGLNSDLSVKKLKGHSRPIINENERSEILSNFDFIDRIVIFNELTPINLIKKIKPSYIFKGDDYKAHEVVGGKEIKKWGGKVVLIKCTKGKSSSLIIERIKNGT